MVWWCPTSRVTRLHGLSRGTAVKNKTKTAVLGKKKFIWSYILIFRNFIQFKSTHTDIGHWTGIGPAMTLCHDCETVAFPQYIRYILLAHSLTAWVVFVSAIALLPLVWRGCEATAREQIYLLLLEPAAKNTFSKQDAQILPYFDFTDFVH